MSLINKNKSKTEGEQTRVIPKAGGTEIKGENKKHYLVPRTKPRNFYLGVAVTTIKMLFVTILVVGVGCMGALFGVASAYVETSPIVDAAVLTDIEKTSLIYDKNGKEIAKYTGTETRIWTKIDEMPEHLVNAFVSIEDTRFYSHEGIDYKRLFGAFVGNLQSSSVQGGSTISQQLVKLRMLTSERSYKRKIQEAYMTSILEKEYTKDQILEAYMNTILLGGSNYGVQTAANDYFNKDVSQLTIREAAMLAGITQSPNQYNPRTNFYVTDTPEVINDRTDLVLNSMYAAGRITKEEYADALAEEVHIEEKSSVADQLTYAYFIEYAITDIIDHMLIERGLDNTTENRNAIDQELREGGYKIHLTIDTEIQNIVQDSLSTYSSYPKMQDPSDSKTTENIGNDTITIEQPQAAATVYDYKTGEYRAIIGGRDIPFAEKLWNRATSSKSGVGSSIKPLAVYAPAIDMGMSPTATVDNSTSRIPGWDSNTGYPTGSGPNGTTTLQEGVVQSMNRVAARVLLQDVGLDESVKYLEAFGIDPTHIVKTPSGLALGNSPITSVELASAFGTIANNGIYQLPLSFSKVVDTEGKTILDGKAIQAGTTSEAIQPSTAYMMTDILVEAVNRGTGTGAKIPGMTTAGKTGTNSDHKGVTFAGYTPYYAASVFIGHDNDKPLAGSYSGTFAAPLWKSFMARIHEGLEDKPIIEGDLSDFGLHSVSICSVSGKVATEACHHDALGKTPTSRLVTSENVPSETCDQHVLITVCAESLKLATDGCEDVILIGIVQSMMEEYVAAITAKYPGINLNATCDMNHSGETQPEDNTLQVDTELNDLRIQASTLLYRANLQLTADEKNGTATYDLTKAKTAYNQLYAAYNNENTTAATLRQRIANLQQYIK